MTVSNLIRLSRRRRRWRTVCLRFEVPKQEEASPASYLVRARRGLLCRVVLKIWIMTEEGRIQDSRLGTQKVCGPVEAVINRQVV